MGQVFWVVWARFSMDPGVWWWAPHNESCNYVNRGSDGDPNRIGTKTLKYIYN